MCVCVCVCVCLGAIFCRRWYFCREGNLAVLCLVIQSCPALCDPMDCSPPGFSVHGDSPGKNTEVGYRALLQGIFPTQGFNPCLPHCRQILYQLSHKGSPKILEWVAYPFSSGSSQPRNWTGVFCLAWKIPWTKGPGRLQSMGSQRVGDD